jgi:plastocyanin
MRAWPRRVALMLGGCAATLLCVAAIGEAAPTGWGSAGGAPDWTALQAQLRAQAAARKRQRCAPRAHPSHGHRRCSHKPRHGASSTKPTAGGAPQAAAGAGGGALPAEGLSPTLPGVPVPGAPGSPGAGTGASEEPAPPSVPHVQVIAVEYHYTLSRTTVPAGKVALQFVNNGQDEHNLNVLSGEGELETSFPKTVSHGVRETTVDLRKGNFTLFCSLPEHEAKGMHATLTVQ